MFQLGDRVCMQLEPIPQHSRRKAIQILSEFFLQQCCCGAASLTFQETKLHSRSDFSSLTASNSALSDLSTIPEVTQQTGKAAATEIPGILLTEGVSTEVRPGGSWSPEGTVCPEAEAFLNY
ncbi:hypothetical protein Z043_110501 [Scleropages formosus]|uniref:Uncharacterized protein n=1 Tax=Scleropages formosus TaxID=113540 RepID=A0A0P7X8A6_SCLFO|nr:hypothetical protein Z043_110501 [Scleropages formosus]